MKNYLMGRNNGYDLFGSAFDDLMRPFFYGEASRGMNTDIKEKADGYEVAIDMPGYEKKDITVSLKDGYLTVKAERKEKEEDERHYVYKERSLSCSRSYYVGNSVTEEDIKAKYVSGTLLLDIPKKDDSKKTSANIEIE